MKNLEALGQERMGKLLLRLSAPSIVGMLVQSLYNVVDAFFVGRGVGPKGIAAVFAAFPLQILVMAFSLLLGAGGVSVISRSLGAGKKDRAERTVGTVMTVAVGWGLVLALSNMLLATPLTRFLDMSGDVAAMSVTYIRTVALGIPFFSFFIVTNNSARGEGNARLAMSAMLVSGILNCALDALFIFGFDWGVAGAAWATTLSQAMGALWLAHYYVSGKSVLKPTFTTLKPDLRILSDVVRVGFSAFFSQLGVAFMVGFLNKIFLECGGETALAAYGLLQRTSSLIVMPLLGLSQGMVPIVGYNWGAKDFDRVRQAFFFSVLFASILGCLGAGALFFFPKEIFSLFSDDLPLIETGVEGARLMAFGILFAGFQILASGFYQGLGRGLPSLCFSVLRQFVLTTPLIWALSRLFGLKGAWWAFPISDTTAFFLTLLFFLYDRKRPRRLLEN